MADKLNSMRALEQRKIAYITHEFPDSIHSADGVADYLGLPREMVYKTLVALPPAGKPMLVMTAGSGELNLKKVAKATGCKKV